MRIPYLGPTPDQPLETGMVLAFEPLVFETGFNFGMQIKDVVVITDGGCELLSDFTNTDRMIVVKWYDGTLPHVARPPDSGGKPVLRSRRRRRTETKLVRMACIHCSPTGSNRHLRLGG